MPKIEKYFKQVDPQLHKLIVGNDWHLNPRRNYSKFAGLCRIVAGQQLSVKAAHSIYTKFSNLFPNGKPTPEYTLGLTNAELRSCGLSQSKCRSIRALAEACVKGELPLLRFKRMSDAEIAEYLLKIPGIGPWSVEMFLMFYLGREDIFSAGDLGLRTAIMRLDKLKELPTPEEAAKRAERWSPYRTYACRILWQSLDNTPT